jgi:hypothetical protein
MADPVNTDVERAFSLMSGPLAYVGDQNATVTNSQAGALRVRGQMFCITASVSLASVALPSLVGGDAPPLVIIINESPNTIRIGCPNATDTLNGTPTNAAFSTGVINLATKNSMICIASQVPFGTRGVATASPNNWHAATLQ